MRSRAAHAAYPVRSVYEACQEAGLHQPESWTARGAKFSALFLMTAFGLLKERGEDAGEGYDQRDATEDDGRGAPEHGVARRAGLLGHVGERQHQRDGREYTEGCSEDVEITAHISKFYFRVCRRVCAVAVLMGWLPLLAGAQQSRQGGWMTPDPQHVDELIKLDRAWGPEMTTPGMMLTLVEKERTESGVTYNLKAVGAPIGKPFALLSWTLGDPAPKKLMFGVAIGADGMVMCGNLEGPCAESQPGDLVSLHFETEPGEPVRVALMAQDNSAKLLAEEMPLPLVAKQGSCTLRAVLLARDAEVVLVEGSGFPTIEPVTITSVSNGEIRTDSKRTDADGYFLMANLPKIAGVSSGELKMTAWSTGCAPTLTVPWGAMQVARGQENPKKPVEASVAGAQ